MFLFTLFPSILSLLLISLVYVLIPLRHLNNISLLNVEQFILRLHLCVHFIIFLPSHKNFTFLNYLFLFDYIDIVYILSLNSQLLNRVQNCCLRLTHSSRKFDHITPIFKRSGWLNIRQRFIIHLLHVFNSTLQYSIVMIFYISITNFTLIHYLWLITVISLFPVTAYCQSNFVPLFLSLSPNSITLYLLMLGLPLLFLPFVLLLLSLFYLITITLM